MATVSGACVIAKVSGLLQIREDTTPSKLIWKAIDQDKSLEVPLNNLQKLQASPDASPKMLLRLFYITKDSPDVQDIKLTFNNRQTMTSVKEALQTIVARQKTVIKDQGGQDSGSKASTPAAQNPAMDSASPTPGQTNDFSLKELLTDTALLKNRALQQKLLLEDKNLRNIFTQSVIKYKLSPAVFWSTRVPQLRSYALSKSQHRGPYNVLSSIKPVATSDNQVNVNVTRDTIGEIFDTYPIVRRAFNEMVPEKLSEGEFWSRFFNSKLFRRLRGEKINNANTRGDVVIDKYLYVDADFVEREANEKDGKSDVPDQEKRVNKFIDLAGNEVDNSQKLGISPDFTMKFSNQTGDQASSSVPTERQPGNRENEMLVLMKNMNKLSSKMVGNMLAGKETPNEADMDIERMEQEVQLSDLQEKEEAQYMEIHLDTDTPHQSLRKDSTLVPGTLDQYTSSDLVKLFETNTFNKSTNGIDLSETYETKTEEINKAALEIIALVKHNFKVNRSTHLLRDPSAEEGPFLLPEAQVQDLITFNITSTEFLLHFWNLFMNSGNPLQLKKLFTTIRTSQNTLNELREACKQLILNNEQIAGNDKLKEKFVRELETCLMPMKASIDKAIGAYVVAVRAAAQEEPAATEINENGKRALQS